MSWYEVTLPAVTALSGTFLGYWLQRRSDRESRRYQRDESLRLLAHEGANRGLEAVDRLRALFAAGPPRDGDLEAAVADLNRTALYLSPASARRAARLFALVFEEYRDVVEETGAPLDDVVKVTHKSAHEFFGYVIRDEPDRYLTFRPEFVDYGRVVDRELFD